MNLTDGVNGVTKRIVGNIITYLSPYGIAIVDTSTTAITFIYLGVLNQDDTVLFADITDNFGTANAEAYVDELANRRLFFFDTSDASGGVSDVNIVSQSAGLALDASLQSLLSGQSNLSLEATQQLMLNAILNRSLESTQLNVLSVLSGLNLETTQQSVLSAIQSIQSGQNGLNLETTQQAVLASFTPILNAIVDSDDKKYEFYSISDIDDLQCNSAGTKYVCLAFQIAANPVSSLHYAHSLEEIAQTNDDYKWKIHENPILTGTPTFITNPSGGDLDIYVPPANSVPPFQIVNDGRIMYSGVSQANQNNDLNTPLRLRQGNLYVLSIEPITNGLDYFGSLNTKEK